VNTKFLKILMVSCLAGLSVTLADSGAPLAGTWFVTDIRSREVLKDSEPSLQFSEDGRISATAGCNKMSSSADVDDDGIAIGMIAATRMICPEPLMNQESEFMMALELVRRFNISGDLLTLIGDKDETLMSATRKPAGEPGHD
jgi:putative lipoprotein